jgi:glycosyltransferase involved in cell wall biosynthesis
MKITLSAHRPFHFVQLANALASDTNSVQLYSSAPRRFFRGLDNSVSHHFTPSPILLASHTVSFFGTGPLLELDTLLYDLTVAAILPSTDTFIGLATRSLRSAKAAKLHDARFVLDRACPHVYVQQALLEREADRTRFRFRSQPQWLVDRQLEEYAIADAILIPSNYSGDTFPSELKPKLTLAPLLGRITPHRAPPNSANQIFTLGVIGNSPLRKGYLYLLRAWKQLALPKSQLIIRCAGGFDAYPALRQLLNELHNVHLIPYVADLSSFYRSLDVFILPSIDDGFGMALFEALACGVPTIATTACGASELLAAGLDSLIVPAASEDAIAEAILRLYQSPELRRTIGCAGAATAIRIQEARIYQSAVQGLMARLGE